MNLIQALRKAKKIDGFITRNNKHYLKLDSVEGALNRYVKNKPIRVLGAIEVLNLPRTNYKVLSNAEGRKLVEE